MGAQGKSSEMDIGMVRTGDKQVAKGSVVNWRHCCGWE